MTSKGATVEFKVRPLANPTKEKGSLQGAARVYVNKDALIALTKTLDEGTLCTIKTSGGPSFDEGKIVSREASLWLPDQNISANVVMMTKAYQDAAGFRLGDKVRIVARGKVEDADEVVVADVTSTEAEAAASLAGEDEGGWLWAIKLFLKRAGDVFPGMSFEIAVVSEKRRFEVLTVNERKDSVARVKPSTQVRIRRNSDESAEDEQKDVFDGTLELVGVPAFDRQLERLNIFFESFRNPFHLTKFQQLLPDYVECGVVIHGSSGSGKSFLLNRIAALNWGRVWRIKRSDKLSAMQEILTQARAQQPSIVLIDDFEKIIADRPNRTAIIDFLCETLDEIASEAVSNGALPKVVMAFTCKDFVADMPEELRPRISTHIPLPIPDQKGRLEILKYYNLALPPTSEEDILSSIAQRTHAFNPRDLYQLVKRACAHANVRITKAGGLAVDATSGVEREDVEDALRHTKPSGMHDINLKPPTVHWKDIGGQEHVKKALQQMIRRTMGTVTTGLYANPPKGILLYGPPGCAKTLSAQAFATESGFNFFSVKGAELLNMYVGESERAVRSLFERARSMAPSIVFFDEIDALGGSRTGGGSGPGGGSRGRTQASVNVLTTLLTELDGFEKLEGVLVLAATNYPEAVDSALMRPGRFGKSLYVGPPDLQAREVICRLRAAKIHVSADIEFDEIARRTEGCSGADLHEIWDMAGEKAEEREGNAVEMRDLVAALGEASRSITREMTERYEKWGARRRMGGE